MSLLDKAIIVTLLIVGVYDLWLYYKARPTLSQMYQKLLPTIADLVVFVIAFLLLCYADFIDVCVRIAIAGILGHVLLPNTERYGR